MGLPLTWDLAADIYVAAGRLETLVNTSSIEQIKPMICDDVVFARERIESIVGEIKLLHQAHWNETEAHRHRLVLNPDYDVFIRYERAGRYVLFTLRSDGQLQGNCALYLDKSTHTQTLIATEDTLYLLPEARKRVDCKTVYRVLRKRIKVAGREGNQCFRQNGEQGWPIFSHAWLSPRGKRVEQNIGGLKDVRTEDTETGPGYRRSG